MAAAGLTAVLVTVSALLSATLSPSGAAAIASSTPGDWDDASSPPAEPSQVGDVCSIGWLASQQRSAGSAGEQTVAVIDGLLGAFVMEPTDPRTESLADTQQTTGRYPNDTYFRLYQRDSLMAIGALDAWDTSHGGDDVVIAVVSTGVHYTHTDLVDKMWSNPLEIPGNGIDDDGNGYIDDINGWSFPDDTGVPADFPRGRGTMMAGIAAADSNNDEGVAGVSWGAKIMALRTMVLRHDEDHDVFVGTVDDQVEAVCYAANNGAQVILFGGYLQDPINVADDVESLRQAIEYAHLKGAVVVAPAGDCALQQDYCPSFESYGENPTILPAAFRYVVGVQSYGNGRSERAEASYGSWVDITAPGEEFMTTSADPPYSYVRHQRATSDFAAAHVAGVAAVIRSVNPDLSPYQVEQVLYSTADRPRGVEFDFPPDGLPRNDHWGHGVVDFERAVESVPPRMRVHPVSAFIWPAGRSDDQLAQITDGVSDPAPVRFANPYLSAGAWQLVADTPWVSDATAAEVADGTSTGSVAADLVALAAETGPLQQGMVYTAAIQACATGWSRDRSPCQSFSYRLTFVDRLTSRYLPLVVRPSLTP